MNRLQKKAWIEFAFMIGLFPLLVISVGALVRLDARGIISMLIFLVVGGAVLLLGCIYEIRVFGKYDEREKKIYLFALLISCLAFVVFQFSASFIILFSVGAGGVVPAYSILGVFITGSFFAQLVLSAVILIKCAAEENDG